MQTSSEANDRYAEFRRKSGLVLFEGFYVVKETPSRSRSQLAAIKALTSVQKQFVGTLVDTEAAVGYFLRRARQSERPAWIAYLAVKMKHRGDLARLAELVSHEPPSRSLNKNTITQSLDLRWSIQVQGVVAYALLQGVRPFLYNEKSIIEVDCILSHGPIVSASKPHPFLDCGAKRVRRGVWYWSQIDNKGPAPTGHSA